MAKKKQMDTRNACIKSCAKDTPVTPQGVIDILACIDHHAHDGVLFSFLINNNISLRVNIIHDATDTDPTATTHWKPGSSTMILDLMFKLNVCNRGKLTCTKSVGKVPCKYGDGECLVLLLMHEYTHMIEFMTRYNTHDYASYHRVDKHNKLFTDLFYNLFEMIDDSNDL